MKRIVLALGLVLALPASAVAQTPTQQHVHQYQALYHRAAHAFGKRTPGRNIVRDGTVRGAASDSDVAKSIVVLKRMFVRPAPAPVPPPSMVGTSAGALTTAATGPNMQGVAPPPAPSGLEQCIIQHESGGNSQAVNGQYEGIGQWSPSAWAEDGGTKYASSPLSASAAQQEAVLRAEGAATMEQQQGQYDGC